MKKIKLEELKEFSVMFRCFRYLTDVYVPTYLTVTIFLF